MIDVDLGWQFLRGRRAGEVFCPGGGVSRVHREAAAELVALLTVRSSAARASAIRR